MKPGGLWVSIRKDLEEVGKGCITKAREHSLGIVPFLLGDDCFLQSPGSKLWDG